MRWKASRSSRLSFRTRAAPMRSAGEVSEGGIPLLTTTAHCPSLQKRGGINRIQLHNSLRPAVFDGLVESGRDYFRPTFKNMIVFPSKVYAFTFTVGQSRRGHRE